MCANRRGAFSGEEKLHNVYGEPFQFLNVKCIILIRVDLFPAIGENGSWPLEIWREFSSRSETLKGFSEHGLSLLPGQHTVGIRVIFLHCLFSDHLSEGFEIRSTALLPGCESISLLLLALLFEVFATEFNQVFRVVPDHFLWEILEDLREFLRHINLVWRENSHLTHVCHLFVVQIQNYIIFS